MWKCLDPTPVPKDRRSRPLIVGITEGEFVYVQALDGVIWVLLDGPHRHPKVLGGGLPAMYAGDLTVSSGEIVDVTNLSGTFQLDDPAGLLSVAERLEDLGFIVVPGAVRFFPMDGGRPIVLR
jgi:hypothetical protein